jgi:hypothetical protein
MLEKKLESWIDNVKTWGKVAMPEIYGDYQEYIATGKYPYLAQVEEFIMQKRGLPEELRKKVHTQCYIASQQHRIDTEEANRVAMITSGWRPLDKQAVDDALATGKKLQVNAVSQNDWMSVKIDNVYKPHIFAKGTDREQYGLMKPNARTHGYAIHQFDNAFCKLV